MNVQRLQALRRAQQYHLLPIKPGMMIEIHEKLVNEITKEFGNLKDWC